MASKQVKRARYKLIEEEIRTYHQQLQRIEQLRSDIIEASAYNDGQPRPESTGDPTGNKALKLVSTAVLLETQRMLSAISRTLEQVRYGPEPNKYRLVELRYWDRRYNDARIIDELNISRATYFRWCGDIVRLVAKNLGWEI